MLTAQMQHLARQLRAWVQAEDRSLQDVEAQVLRVLHDLGKALLAGWVPLAAPFWG